jgi:hypothetical protein
MINAFFLDAMRSSYTSSTSEGRLTTSEAPTMSSDGIRSRNR